MRVTKISLQTWYSAELLDITYSSTASSELEILLSLGKKLAYVVPVSGIDLYLGVLVDRCCNTHVAKRGCRDTAAAAELTEL